MVGREKAKHWGPPEARGPDFDVTSSSVETAAAGQAGRAGWSSRTSVGPGRPRRTERAGRASPLVRQSARVGRGRPRMSRSQTPSCASRPGTAAPDHACRAGQTHRPSVSPSRPQRAKRAARCGALERHSTRHGQGGPSGPRGPVVSNVSRPGPADADQEGLAGRLPGASVGRVRPRRARRAERAGCIGPQSDILTACAPRGTDERRSGCTNGPCATGY